MLDEKSLARDEGWQRSRFGELEAFMVEYLVGGASAGESLRLKLQTPLFVSDALLEAARQQLQAELSTAEQVWRDPGPVSENSLLCFPEAQPPMYVVQAGGWG